MPIFEYKCVKCGAKVEFLEAFGNRRVRICPDCGSKELEKQLSIFSPRIKEGASKRCYGCSDDSCPHAGH